MLDHCTYDKVKLLHELSKIAWFIEKHAKPNAKREDEMKCFEHFDTIIEQIEAHIAILRADLSIK